MSRGKEPQVNSGHALKFRARPGQRPAKQRQSGQCGAILPPAERVSHMLMRFSHVGDGGG